MEPCWQKFIVNCSLYLFVFSCCLMFLDHKSYATRVEILPTGHGIAWDRNNVPTNSSLLINILVIMYSCKNSNANISNPIQNPGVEEVVCSDLPGLNIVVSVHRGHGRRAICGQFYVLQGGSGLYCTVLYNFIMYTVLNYILTVHFTLFTTVSVLTSIFIFSTLTKDDGQ